MATAVLWFRRDLRLADQPALLAAAQVGEVVALFVLDPVLLRAAEATPRLAFLLRSLRALDAELRRSYGGGLIVRTGDPGQVVPAVAAEVAAGQVHVSADFGPYGARRDAEVERRLAERGGVLVRTGSPYAVSPGRLTTAAGGRYRVYTPYSRAWQRHGVPRPAPRPEPARIRFRRPGGGPIELPPEPELGGTRLPPAGEDAAWDRMEGFLDRDVAAYGELRDRPASGGSSGLSPYLKVGSLHPRTVLARLPPGPGAQAFRAELAWRDFYADVLAANPDSGWQDLRPALAGLDWDRGPSTEPAFAAWTQGRTGYPFVDAGMRQLRAEGWMHNRARMVTASFLVKDLHIEWTRGARWFLHRLVDGDLASNNHGWQWVAGTGTDAAPFFRVFHPVTQGERFDPDGDYIRRWLPELGNLRGREVHRPWERPAGPPPPYPAPIVDHARERVEALRRYHDRTVEPGRGPGRAMA